MPKLNYALEKNNYSLETALSWGNCIRHCKKASEGRLDHRAIHVCIAVIEFLPIFSQIASIFEMLIVIRFADMPAHSIRCAQLIEKALSSKAVKHLYDTANSTPNYDDQNCSVWTIDFVTKTSSGFLAECCLKERKIKLHENLSDDKALSYLVFELTNAIHSRRFFELHSKALKGQIRCEEYAKEAERIEDDGTLLHHQAINESIKELGWSSSLDIYRYNKSCDFEKRWEQIKYTSHCDYWRRAWMNINNSLS